MLTTKLASEGSMLALKLRADISRILKQGHQWSLKRAKCPAKHVKQDSISVGCILTAWKLYVFQFLPPDVARCWGGGRYPNEQV